MEHNKDIAALIEGTQKRYMAIAKVLGFDLHDVKLKEKRQKANYWFFGPQLITDSEMKPGKSLKGTGQAGAAGVDYVVYKDKWRNHMQHILHEETHFWVMREVGEAPSILNEGIAVYTESIIFDGKEELYKKCRNTWRKHMDEPGLLRKMMTNAFFWEHYGKWPVYTIGAAFVYYIAECYGMKRLLEIFEGTHWEDENFCCVAEKKLEITIEELERNAGKFYQARKKLEK